MSTTTIKEELVITAKEKNAILKEFLGYIDVEKIHKDGLFLAINPNKNLNILYSLKTKGITGSFYSYNFIGDRLVQVNKSISDTRSAHYIFRAKTLDKIHVTKTAHSIYSVLSEKLCLLTEATTSDYSEQYIINIETKETSPSFKKYEKINGNFFILETHSESFRFLDANAMKASTLFNSHKLVEKNLYELIREDGKRLFYLPTWKESERVIYNELNLLGNNLIEIIKNSESKYILNYRSMLSFSNYTTHKKLKNGILEVECQYRSSRILNPANFELTNSYTKYTILKNGLMELKTEAGTEILDPSLFTQIILPGCERVEELDEDEASLKIYSTAGSWAKLTLSKNEFVLSAYQFDE